METMFLSPQRARRDPNDIEYPGKPLLPGQIRLIRLLPGAWTDPIQCELFEDVHDTTKYEALSYVWGSQNVTTSIFLNRKEFPVTFNLEGALRNLREQFKDDKEAMIFWIDALCINQKDIEERTNQVQLMGEIYRRCERVVVYLGDRLDGRRPLDEPPPVIKFNKDTIPDMKCDGDTDWDVINIFSLIQSLAQHKDITKISAFSSHYTPYGPPKKSQSRVYHDDKSELFEGLRRLMHPPFTPWWSRVWVIQEVTVAPRVLLVYGTVSAPWEMFWDAAANYAANSRSFYSRTFGEFPRDQANVLSDCCSRIFGIAESRVRSGLYKHINYDSLIPPNTPNDAPSLLDLLRKFRDRRASDPRDKVYALLSLARISYDTPSLIPDYSLSEVEVFRQATLHCIYETESLSVFSSDLGRKFRNDLPSWVPDWSAPGGPTYEARAAAAELYDVCPFGDGEFEKVVRPVGKTGLLVEAFWVCGVRKVGEVMWGGDVPSIWQSTLLSWKNALLAFRQFFAGTMASTQDFWRLICGDVIHRDEGIGQTWSRARKYDELTFMMWAMKSPKSPFQTPMSPIVALREDNFWSRQAMIWWNIQMLWPGQPVLGSFDWIRDQPLEDLVPHGIAEHQHRNQMIRMLLEFLGGYGLNNDITGNYDPGWKELPWKDILSRLNLRLQDYYGAGAELDPEVHQDRIPNFDNSIMAATLSRPLIMSDRYVGLGPADTKEGDRLFFIKGGKTPFVLRETSAQPGLADPKYLVGDCYIQGLMNVDCVSKDDPRSKWTTIALV
jgi:hypothetical protein